MQLNIWVLETRNMHMYTPISKHFWNNTLKGSHRTDKNFSHFASIRYKNIARSMPINLSDILELDKALITH